MDGLTKRELEIIAEICNDNNCGTCLFTTNKYISGCYARVSEAHKYIPRIKEICSNWEEEHRHTYLKEFRKRFPENTLHDDVITGRICSREVFHNDISICKRGNMCKQCWSEEYKQSNPTQD